LVRQDDWIIIDGDAGVVIVNPSPIILAEYGFKQRQAELERERLSRLRHTPAMSLDGQRVELLANIEMPDDAVAALSVGAVGVGLFRSEFLFMGRVGPLPDEQEQYLAYCRAVEGMKGLPVTIRTVDIGADTGGSALATDLFRGHKTGRPKNLAGSSQFGGGFNELGDSEIGDVRLLVCVQQHIRRLEIPMEDALVMGKLDGCGDGEDDAGGLSVRHGFVAGDGSEIPALDVIHDEEGDSIMVADVADRDDARMDETGGERCLRVETSQATGSADRLEGSILRARWRPVGRWRTNQTTPMPPRAISRRSS
jgi:hypothetical protein